MQKEDISSPTAYLESIILTSVINPKEDRDVATIDIPNFFIQTPCLPHSRDLTNHVSTFRNRGVRLWIDHIGFSST